MQILLSFAGLIALLSFAVMCIYVVIALKDSRNFLKNATESLQQTVKIIQQMEIKSAVTLETAKTTFDNIDKKFETLDKGLNHFNAVAKRVDELEMSLQKKIEGPLMQAATIVSGVSKAVSAFTNSWSKGK